MRISDWSSDVCSSDLEKGTLSTFLIKNSPFLPYPCTYVRRFGSMSAAYLLIGFDEPTHNDRNSLRFQWTEEMLLDVIRRIYLEKVGRASCRERVCQYV